MVGKPRTTQGAEEGIRALEQEYRLGGLKKANNIVQLLSYVKPSTPGCVKAIHASRRTLLSLEKNAEVDETFRKWLLDRRSDFSAALLSVLTAPNAVEKEVEAAVAGAALTHRAVWADLLKKVFEDGGKGPIGELVLESFVSRFGDLRLTALELVKDKVGSLDARLHVLSYCSSPVEMKNARAGDGKFSEKDLRKTFGTAWMKVLGDKMLTAKHRRDILERLPKELIPNMSDPLKLADFLSDSYNNGKDISVAVSALDGLFVLISKHGLDYPLFYQKLYALMSPTALFYAEGRNRFLELTALFLRQGAMLPGGLVASFVKRLVRRALHAPTESALWCLRLALDLLYKHPNVSYLVHRSVNLFEENEPSRNRLQNQKRPRTAEHDDPYDDDELDPQASNADKSSLWELEILSTHISPAVSRLVAAFSRDVRKNPVAPPGLLSDYAGLSFEDMFQAEFKRRAKSSHLAYNKPGASVKMVELHGKLQQYIEWA